MNISARLLFVGCIVLLSARFSGAQVVTFNAPSPWQSLREGTVVVKALLDTARIGKKSVVFSAYRAQKNKKVKIGSYTVRSKDYVQEFTIANARDEILGGQDFLSIEWAVAGSQNDKGALQPFGVAIVNNEKIPVVAHAVSAENLSDITAITGLLEGKQFVKIGSTEMACVWNMQSIGLVFKKSESSLPATITFDGKNGKQAFLAYADRFVEYSPSGDSVHSWHFARDVNDAHIAYTKETWNNEISVVADSNNAVVIIPWSDLGIIPFKERKIGCAIFSGSNAALPEKAQRDIPGTWGDLVLD